MWYYVPHREITRMPQSRKLVKAKRASSPGRAQITGRIAVLHKAFDLIDLLEKSEKPKSLDALVDCSGIARSTVHRLLLNMISRGYIAKDSFGSYTLGTKLLELGATVKQRESLRDVVRPFMEELRDQLGETVNLGRLQGDSVLYLDTIESQHPIRVTGSLGVVDPVYATSIGKAILAWMPLEKRPVIRNWKRLTPATICEPELLAAELERVKRQGYALDNEESMEGGRCIGVPILYGGCPIAGLSISGPISRIARGRIDEIAQRLKRASSQITSQLRLYPERFRP
jgi:DNA-binding IclR family transcriptional regulator